MLFEKLPITALFLGRFVKILDNDAHMETFLKESNEDVIKVNQKVSYTKCRLSHYTLTKQEKVGKK